MSYLDIAAQVRARQTQRKQPAADSGLRAPAPRPPETGNVQNEIDEINALSPDAATLRAHLAALLPAIHAGCQRGLAEHLDRTPAQVVTALLADADPRLMPAPEYEVRCRAAGEAATLAALIAEYRTRLQMLQELGEDIFTAAAALELALLWCPPTDDHTTYEETSSCS